MNWFKKLLTSAWPNKKPYRSRPAYNGPARYFGPMQLINYNGNPAIIGNTMKINKKDILQQLGFSWNGNISIDGTQVNVPNGAINGLMIGNRILNEEDISMLQSNGVDISKKDISFPDYVQQEPQIMETEQPESEENIINQPVKSNAGAQSDQSNTKMLEDFRNASGNYQATREVVKEQLSKLTSIMSNYTLSAEQEQLRKDFLKFMSGAHNYSFYNTILIFMQRRNASMTGGAKTLWSTKGRQVKPGENPIVVFAPNVKKLTKREYYKRLSDLMDGGKNEAEAKKIIKEESKSKIFSYTPVNIYDVSQTESIPGQENSFDYEGFHKSYLHKINEPEERSSELWKVVQSAMKDSGIDVSQSDTGQAGGMSSGGKVVIDERSIGQRLLSTAFHEWAHEVLHQTEEARKKRIEEKTPKHIIEAEADATAWLLMQAFGLDGDPKHAARYLLLWQVTTDEVMSRQEQIHKAYSSIYKKINDKIDSMVKPAQPTQPTQPAQPAQPAFASNSWYGKLMK